MVIMTQTVAALQRGAGELDLEELRRADRTGLLEGIDRAVAFELPMRTRFRGITARDGVLLHGPAGWGEVAPFWNYDADAAAPWLASALEQAVAGVSVVGDDAAATAAHATSPHAGGGARGALPAYRSTVPVNVTVPEVGPHAAHRIVTASGATTAKVKVAGDWSSLDADKTRLEVVRAALGPAGRVRIDVNGGWDLESAVRLLPQMDRAAGGLEYAEQPCASVEDLAALRRRTSVPVAADESVRLSADPLAVARLDAADVVVLKVAPLGGVRRALALAERLGLPAVVSSALDTSVGIGAGTHLAAALEHLPYACGLGTVSLFEADVAVPSLVPDDGRLAVRDAHVSATMLDAVTASATVTARWQERLAHVLAALAERRQREAADPAQAVGGVRL